MNKNNRTGLGIKIALPTISGPRESHIAEPWENFEKYGIQNIENQDILETRAQNQSAGEKWLHGAGKMGVIAGTTVLDGIIGTAVGLGDIFIGEGIKGSDFWNNPFSVAMEELNQKAEQWMPNYYTKAEQREPFYKHMGANFWADKVLKNMGFMIGTVVDGMITGGAAFAATGGKAAANRIAKGMVGKVLKGGKVLENEKDVINAFRKGQISSADLAKGLQLDAQAIKRANAVSQVTGSVLAAGAESRIEAIGAMNEFRDNMQRKHPNMDPQEINDLAVKVGNGVFAMDMAILSLSNFAQFRNAFSGSKMINSKLKGAVKGNIDKGFRVAGQATKAARTGTKVKNVVKGFKNPLLEGLEESMQMVSAETSEDFHMKELDPDNRKDFNEFISSMVLGMKETFGSNEGQENFAIGAIIGMIGAPTFGLGGSDYKAFGVLPMAGGIAGDIRENFDRTKRASEMIASLNKVVEGEDFKNLYNGMLRSYGYIQDAEEALENGNMFDYENASLNQFVNDALTFAKVGKLEDFLDHLESFKNTDPEQLREILQVKMPEGLNEKEKEEWLRSAQDPIRDMTPEQLRSYMHNKVSKLEETAKKAIELKQDLDIKFPEMPDKAKHELVRYFLSAKDADRRMGDLGKEVADLIGGHGAESFKNAYQEEADLQSRKIDVIGLLNKHRALKGWETRRSKKVRELQEQIEGVDPGALGELMDKYEQSLKTARGMGDVLLEEQEGKGPRQRAKLHKKWNRARASYSLLRNRIRAIEEKLANPEQLEEDRFKLESHLEQAKKELEISQAALLKINAEALREERKLSKEQEEALEKAFKLYYENGDVDISEREDEFFEQFRSRVEKNMDLLDELNMAVQNAVALNPAIKNTITLNLNDMQALARRRTDFLNKYATGLSGSKTIVESMAQAEREFFEDYLTTEKDKYWDGRKIMNRHTGEQGVIRILGDDMYLEINKTKQKVEFDQEFWEAWKPVKDKKDAKVSEKSEEADAAYYDKVYDKGGEELFVTGTVVQYNDNKYLRVRVLDRKGNPIDRYHLILEDDSISPTSWTSNNVEVTEKIKEVEQGVEKVFAGKIAKFSNQFYLYRHLPNKELSDKLKKGEEVSDTELEKLEDHMETEETEEVASEEEAKAYEASLNKTLNFKDPVLAITVSKRATAAQEKKNKQAKKKNPEYVNETLDISNPEVLALIIEQYPEVFSDLRSLENPANGIWVELTGVPEGLGIGRGTVKGFVKFPKKHTVPVGVRLTRYYKKGKRTYRKDFWVNDPEKIKNIKVVKKTKKGGTLVKYTDSNGKTKTYFRTFVKYPKREGVRAFRQHFKYDDKGDPIFTNVDFSHSFGEATKPGLWVSNLDKVNVVKETEKGYIIQFKGNKDYLFVPKTEVKHTINKNLTINDKSQLVPLFEKARKERVGKRVRTSRKPVDTDPVKGEKAETVSWAPRRVLGTIFRGLAGNVGSVEEGQVRLNNDRSQVRYGRFMYDTDFSEGSYAVRLHKPEDILGDAWKTRKEELRRNYGDDIDKAILTVFINTETGNYVDVEGNDISADEIAEKGIYTTLGLPKLESPNYKKYAENANYSEKDLEKERAAYEKDYEVFWEQLEKEERVELPITGKGIGVPVFNPDGKTISLQDFFGTEELPELFVTVNTTGSIDYNGVTYENVRLGFTYAIDPSGNLIELQPRQLNEEDADKVVAALEYFVNSNLDKLENREKWGGSVINDKTGEPIMISRHGETPREMTVSDILSFIAPFTGKNNLTATGQELYNEGVEDILDPADEDLRNKYLLIKDNAKRFHFLNNPKVPGGEIVIGIREDGSLWKAPLVVEGGLNREVRDRILEFIPTRYQQIDSAMLGGDREAREYVHVESIGSDGRVTTRRFKEEDGGYKQYLLTHESTPVRTRLIALNNEAGVTALNSTESVPPRINQYALMEIPTEEIPDQEESGEKVESEKDEKLASWTEAATGNIVKVQVSKSGKIIVDALFTVGEKELEAQEDSEKPMNDKALQKVNEAPTGREALSKIFDMKAAGADVEVTRISEGVSIVERETEEEDEDYDYDEQYEEEDDDEDLGRTKTGEPAQLENIAKTRAWFKNRFPKVDFEVVERLIKGRLYGVFKDSAVYIYENAEIGTTYHESFHVTTQLFLRGKERKALYKEAENTPELQSVIQKNLDKGLPRWRAIEEALAEEFRDFVMNEGTVSFRRAPVKQSFFVRLWNMIKEFILKPASIEEVFNRIEAGYYRRRRVKPVNVTLERAFRTDNPSFNSQGYANDVVQGINFHFFRHFFRNPDGVDKMLNTANNQEDIKAYNKAKRGFERKLKFYKESLASGKDKQGQVLSANKIAGLKRRISGLKFALENWNEAVWLHNRYMAVYNFEVPDEDTVNNGIPEEERAGGRGTQFAYEALKYNTKMNASRGIKLLIGSLPNEITGQKIKKRNDLGFITTVDWGKTFNILTNSLQNTESVSEIQHILMDLETKVPGVGHLIRRLRLDQPGHVYSAGEMEQLIQFSQVFAKNRNNFDIGLIGEGGTARFLDASVDTLAHKVQTEWASAALVGSQGSYSKYYDTSGSVPKYKRSEFKKFDKINRKNLFEFLNVLGIRFADEETALKMFGGAMIRRAGGILNAIKSGKQSFIFAEEEDTEVSQDIRKFAKYAAMSGYDYMENGHFNINGDRVYDQTLNNFVSLSVNRINKTKSREELNRKMPYLDPDNNEFVRNSMVLNRLFGKKGIKLTIRLLDGLRVEEDGSAVEFNKMSPVDKLAAWIHAVEAGRYPMIRPSDNKLERFFEFGQLFNQGDIDDGEHITQFVEYLEDEVASKASTELSGWQNTDTNGGTGIMLDILQRDKSELARSYYSEFMKYVNKEKSLEELRTFMKDPQVQSELGRIINDYFTYVAEELMDVIKKEGLVAAPQSSGKMMNVGLPINKDGLLTEEDIFRLAKRVSINFAAGNIEQMKLFLGNPVFYTSVENAFKRFSGAVGTKKIIQTDPMVNKWIEKYLTRRDRTKPLYDDDVSDSEYRKPILRTVVVDDLKITSANIKYLEKVLGKKAARKYIDMNESDGYGYITLDEYREFMFRSGDWSFGVGSQEELYQWEMQELRGVPEKQRIYFDPVSKEKRKIRKSTLGVFNQIKPQHFGNMAEQGFVPGMYKLSVMPLIPSVLKTTEGNTQLYDVMLGMMRKKAGMLVYQSANKVGTGANTRSIYNEDGSVNIDFDGHQIQDTYYENWGIQVDTGFKVKEAVPSGTQMGKHIMNSLYRNGTAKDPVMEKAVHEYMGLVGKRKDYGIEELATRIGLKRNTNGEWDLSNPKRLIKRLKREAIRANQPDNVIDSIHLLEKGLGVDTLINRTSVERLLASMADNYIIHIKRFGGGKYQGSSSLFEVGVRKADYDDGKMRSSDLKFYQEEGGKITQMEVYLPNYFKGKVPENLDPRFMEAIGFRIPTQGFSSIDSIKIKGFLPESAGELVVVPSEIVAKAGSDFDIDKLNIYLPNFYYDEHNVPVYIEYSDNLEKAWTEYADVQQRKLIEKLFKKVQYESSLRRELKEIISMLRDTGSLEIEDLRDVLMDAKKQAKGASEQLHQEYDNVIGVLNEMVVTEQDIAKVMSLAEYSRKASENRMNEVMKEIILYPPNIEALVTPLSTDILTGAADFVKGLRGDSAEARNWADLVNPVYVLEMNRRFMAGKEAVGITALASTWHVLSQIHNVQMDISTLGEEGEDPPKMSLDHNSVDGNIALGATHAKDGNSIANVLSQWINAAVDAAKDPFMFDLNGDPTTLGTILMLTQAGVPIKTIALFMNQPIVRAYTEAKRRNESLVKKANGRDESQRNTEKKIRKQFPGKATDIKFTDEVLQQGIENEKSLTKAQRDIQQQILKEYLVYEKAADQMRIAIQGTTFDTNSIGKSTNELLYKLFQTEYVKRSPVFINYDKVVDSTEGEAYIGHFNNGAKTIKEMYKPLFSTMLNKNFSDQVDKLLGLYVNEDSKLGKDKIVKILDKFRSDFLTYLLMTREYVKDGELQKKKINGEIDRLFKGSQSVPRKVQALKKSRKYRNNKFIELLEPVVNTTGYSYMKLSSRRMEPLEANEVTEGWRMLFEAGDSLGWDIAKFVIIQSGMQNSPMNFIDFMPYEVYESLMSSIIELEDAGRDRNYNDFFEQFFIHNYGDPNIVSKRKKDHMPFWKSVRYKKKWTTASANKRRTDRAKGINIYEDMPRIFKHGQRDPLNLPEITKNFKMNRSMQQYGRIKPLLFQESITPAGDNMSLIATITGAHQLGVFSEFFKSLERDQQAVVRQAIKDHNLNIKCD